MCSPQNGPIGMKLLVADVFPNQGNNWGHGALLIIEILILNKNTVVTSIESKKSKNTTCMQIINFTKTKEL
jgi:hypothetical protein